MFVLTAGIRWVLTLKFPNFECKLYRYCLIEVDSVGTVIMLLSMRESDRMRFCELSKAGLHLSYFLLFFELMLKE